MTSVAIVIVSFNARQDLERCLESLAAAPPSQPHEIVVVDNGSTDGAPALVRARFPGVSVIDAGGNLGFAAATNLAIRHTASDLILLLNPDTVVPPGAVDCLADRLEYWPRAAAIGPRLIDTEGRIEISWGPMMSPLAEGRQKLLARAYAANLTGARTAVEWLARGERPVDWVSGACLLVRRADAVAVGLLDERFALYCEDVDFCASLRARGCQVIFTGATEVVHRRGRSRATAPASSNVAYRRSHLAFYEKHHPRWAPILRWYLAARGRLPPA